MQIKINDKIKIEKDAALPLAILFFFIIFGSIKYYQRVHESSYVYGISDGIRKGVRGNFRLYYHFWVDGIEYEGRVPESICKKYIKCCNAGDTVIVRFQTTNPDNNDLVTSFPSPPSLPNQ